ncbi:hypothetical protein XENOCAPTIV_029608 [Xenoophorus captivus]|uniref:Secreted protein n=1 Tax=Xenoophorus captivus TaxID=1517983 RepID=A0ABV0QF53_9TELE
MRAFLLLLRLRALLLQLLPLELRPSVLKPDFYLRRRGTEKGDREQAGSVSGDERTIGPCVKRRAEQHKHARRDAKRTNALKFQGRFKSPNYNKEKTHTKKNIYS